MTGADRHREMAGNEPSPSRILPRKSITRHSGAPASLNPDTKISRPADGT